MEQIYTVDEVAECLKLHRKTVIQMIHKQELTAYKLGSQYRIKENDLADFINRKRINEIPPGSVLV